jgi:hypothetical protein
MDRTPKEPAIKAPKTTANTWRRAYQPRRQKRLEFRDLAVSPSTPEGVTDYNASQTQVDEKGYGHGH